MNPAEIPLDPFYEWTTQDFKTLPRSASNNPLLFTTSTVSAGIKFNKNDPGREGQQGHLRHRLLCHLQPITPSLPTGVWSAEAYRSVAALKQRRKMHWGLVFIFCTSQSSQSLGTWSTNSDRKRSSYCHSSDSLSPRSKSHWSLTAIAGIFWVSGIL